MTEEQIKKIKLKWVSHISMSDYHTSNYVAEGYFIQKFKETLF